MLIGSAGVSGPDHATAHQTDGLVRVSVPEQPADVLGVSQTTVYRHLNRADDEDGQVDAS